MVGAGGAEEEEQRKLLMSGGGGAEISTRHFLCQGVPLSFPNEISNNNNNFTSL